MIVHRHPDGSEGYEYEIGDRVIVDRTTAGGWFNYGPTHSDNCVVQKIKLFKPGYYSTAELFISHSPEWGPAECRPWMVKPHPEALEKASLVLVGAE